MHVSSGTIIGLPGYTKVFNDENMFYLLPSDGPLHMGWLQLSLAFGVCGKNIEQCHVGSKHYSLVLLQLKADMLFQ